MASDVSKLERECCDVFDNSKNNKTQREQEDIKEPCGAYFELKGVGYCRRRTKAGYPICPYNGKADECCIVQMNERFLREYVQRAGL